MPESTLLKQILSDYCAQSDEQSDQQGLLEKFCDYAANWLVANGCLGVGYAASGLTLRFSDGRELSLFSDGRAAADQPAAVSITSTKEKLVTQTLADRTQAVSITGRA